MVDSVAYQYLNTGAANRVLMIFLAKRKMEKRKSGKKEYWAITNNGEIVFTEREAVGYGISEHQFEDAKSLLMETGFISIDDHKGKKGENLYVLTDKWKDFDTENPFQVVKSKAIIGIATRFKSKKK